MANGSNCSATCVKTRPPPPPRRRARPAAAGQGGVVRVWRKLRAWTWALWDCGGAVRADNNQKSSPGSTAERFRHRTAKTQCFFVCCCRELCCFCFVLLSPILFLFFGDCLWFGSGSEWFGSGSERFGAVRNGSEWFGVVRFGVVRKWFGSGSERFGVVRNSLAKQKRCENKQKTKNKSPNAQN